MNIESRFRKIIVHPDGLDAPVTQRILDLAPPNMVEVSAARPELHGELSPQEFNDSKRILYLAPHRGQFFKRCPGARPNLTCCNYFVLNLGVQCDMNCSYCYLQSFINFPYLTVYTNMGQALAELEELAQANAASPFRVGTGETIDSLSLDDVTLYSRDLIQFFHRLPKWRLEFKTKSAKVDQFLDIPHAGNVIVSWSINPQEVISHEEHGTASLDARLTAARKCLDKGFLVAFHIDPMIYHPDWEQNYAGLVDDICKRFAPEEIVYFSLGALRFQPEQRHMMRERFGFKSWVVQGEMWPGKDGKFRYDQKLRETMYTLVQNRFKSHSPRWKIFLCMESLETWLSTFHHKPMEDAEMKDLFIPLKPKMPTRLSESQLPR
jgi:spore photoproduct lyase